MANPPTERPDYQDLLSKIAQLERVEAELREKQQLLAEQNIKLVRRSIELSDFKRKLEDKNYELEHVKEELEDRVRQRTTELLNANEDLQREVAERRQAEAALQRSEKRYRLLTDNSLTGVYIHQGGRFTYVNRRLIEILGEPEEVILSRQFWEFVHPDDREMVRQRGEARSRGEIVHPANYAFRVVRPDGSERWLEVLATTIYLANGPANIGNVVDITERKKAEEEQAKLEALLRQAQKMEAVGTLAGGIAHDFNNLLNVILGFAELAQEHAMLGKSPGHDIEEIAHAAMRASQLVQQILTFSRRSQTNKQPLNLNSLVTHQVEILKRTIPKMINIETKLAPDLNLALCDANQMELVLLNLANNAVDAMEGHGRLSIETQNIVLDETYCRQNPGTNPGPYVLLLVSDTGRGIEEEIRQQIFDPFFTTKDVSKGTGLGLSAVYGTIKDHGGQISCYSELGLGTTMKIYLPTYDGQELAASAEEALAPEQLRGSETILLVDDEDSLREMAAIALEEMGYLVLKATSGEDALEIYRQKGDSVNLVILDLGMPGMGGHRAMRGMLAMNPEAKIIIASGYSANGTVKASLESGASAYLAKPFQLANLLSTVRTLLDNQ